MKIGSSLKHRYTQEDSYNIYFVFFVMFMQISMNFGTSYEFLEIFKRTTDFGNGKIYEQ
jgi:hypothetical protein